MNKIKTIKEVAGIVEQIKKEGKKVVLCHGVFDLIHPGHILHFKSARQHGDVLVVSVTPDRFVRKGPGRPAFNERLRVETLASIEHIDYVVLNEWPTAVETLKRLKPNLYVKGQDYQEQVSDLTGNIALEAEAVRQVGGDIIFTQEEMFSSSNLINKFFSSFPTETDNYLRKFRSFHNASEIIERLKGLSDLKVLVIGEVILDEYVYCIPLAKSPKDAIVATRYDSEEQFAGGAAAIANHLANFCGQVTLLSCFGPNEHHFNFIRSKLSPNINLHSVRTLDRPTIVKRRFLDKTWMAKMYEVQHLNDTLIPNDAEEILLKILEEEMPLHDLVVIADFGHGMFSEKIRNLLTLSNKFLALNTQTNSANLGFNPVTKYHRAHYVSIDEPELRLAARVQYGDLKESAEKLRRELNARHFMVSRGPRGSIFLTGDDEVHETPVFSTKVVDRTGAGDAFFSVTAPCVYKGYPADVVGFIGNCVGALAVEIVCNREPVSPVSLYKFIDHLLK